MNVFLSLVPLKEAALADEFGGRCIPTVSGLSLGWLLLRSGQTALNPWNEWRNRRGFRVTAFTRVSPLVSTMEMKCLILGALLGASFLPSPGCFSSSLLKVALTERKPCVNDDHWNFCLVFFSLHFTVLVGQRKYSLYHFYSFYENNDNIRDHLHISFLFIVHN